MSISPTEKHVKSFIVTGFSARTQNKDEFNEKTAKIPNLWQQFYNSELAGNANVFGVYSDYESNVNGFYTLTAGVESSHAQAELSSVTVKAGNYLVFKGVGSMPAAVIETWKHVWDFFEKNTEYKRNYISDFEAYSGSDQIEIYIGLE